MRRALISLALFGALLIPATASAMPVTYTHDGQKAAKMSTGFARQSARRMANAYIKAQEPYPADTPILRVIRRNRQTVDVMVRYRSYDDRYKRDAACEDQFGEGAEHGYTDVWTTKWRVRFESWASWGNPYRVQTRIVGGGRKGQWNVNPVEHKFGGKGIYMWIVKTLDNGCQL